MKVRLLGIVFPQVILVRFTASGIRTCNMGLHGNWHITFGSWVFTVGQLGGVQSTHPSNQPFKEQWCQTVTFKSIQCHPGLTYVYNF